MRSRSNALAWRLSLLLFVAVFSGSGSSYSVLTHEQVDDLMWKDQIQPLLLKSFPGATEEDLRKTQPTPTADVFCRTWATIRLATSSPAIWSTTCAAATLWKRCSNTPPPSTSTFSRGLSLPTLPITAVIQP